MRLWLPRIALLMMGAAGCGEPKEEAAPPDALVEKVVLLGNLMTADPVQLLEVTSPGEQGLIVETYLYTRILGSRTLPCLTGREVAVDKAEVDLLAALERHGVECMDPNLNAASGARVEQLLRALESVDAAAFIREVSPLLDRLRAVSGMAYERRRPLPEEVGRAKRTLRVHGDRATLDTVMNPGVVLKREDGEWFLSLRGTFDRPAPTKPPR